MKLLKVLSKLSLVAVNLFFSIILVFWFYSTLELNAIYDVYKNNDMCRVKNVLETLKSFENNSNQTYYVVMGFLKGGYGHVIGLTKDGKIIDYTFIKERDYFVLGLKQKIIKFNSEDIYYYVPCAVVIKNKAYGFCEGEIKTE